VSLADIACPSATECFAVGSTLTNGVILSLRGAGGSVRS
jgi:hypothetical protein